MESRKEKYEFTYKLAAEFSVENIKIDSMGDEFQAVNSITVNQDYYTIKVIL